MCAREPSPLPASCFTVELAVAHAYGRFAAYQDETSGHRRADNLLASGNGASLPQIAPFCDPGTTVLTGLLGPAAMRLCEDKAAPTHTLTAAAAAACGKARMATVPPSRGPQRRPAGLPLAVPAAHAALAIERSAERTHGCRGRTTVAMMTSTKHDYSRPAP
jgi:hypothetical protein